jgi:hypothetical protein
MKKTTLYVLSLIMFSTLLTGCGGRTAHPIDLHQPGDDTRSCAVIRSEIDSLQKSMIDISPDSSKLARNTACGVGGLIFFPTLFFMDLKNAEKVELRALQARYNYLKEILNSRKCANGPCVCNK